LAKSRVSRPSREGFGHRRAGRPARAGRDRRAHRVPRPQRVRSAGLAAADCAHLVSSTFIAKNTLRGSPPTYRSHRHRGRPWSDRTGHRLRSDPVARRRRCAITMRVNRTFLLKSALLGDRRIEPKGSRAISQPAARRSLRGQVFRHDPSARYKRTVAFCPRRWPAWLA